MKPDGGFIENADHPAQPHPGHGGQPETLRFPARQCCRIAVAGEVTQTQPFEQANLLRHPDQDGIGDALFGGGEGDRTERLVKFIQLKVSQRRYVIYPGLRL